MSEADDFLISEETADFCSSFESNSEYDFLVDKRPPVISEAASNELQFNRCSDKDNKDSCAPETSRPTEFPEINLNSTDNCSRFHISNGLDDLSLSLNGSEISSEHQFSKEGFSTTHRSNELSLERISHKIILKLRELNQVRSEVNSNYVDWMTSKFVLDTVKGLHTSSHTPSQLTTKIKDIISMAELQKNEGLHMKTESEKIFNVLGLENDDVEVKKNKSLSNLEITALKKHLVPAVKSNCAKLRAQRNSLKDRFGPHARKVVETDTLLSETRVKQHGMYQSLEDKMRDANQLVTLGTADTEALLRLQQTRTQELESATFKLERDKAMYLNITTSIQKEKIDQCIFKDKNTVISMDALGSKLKANVNNLSEQLNSLQTKLSEYKRREAASETYKGIVSEYGKVKKKLDHKKETLQILNDPNLSFN